VGRLYILYSSQTQQTNKICYTGKRRKTFWRWCATTICEVKKDKVSAESLFDSGVGHSLVRNIFFLLCDPLNIRRWKYIERHTKDEEDLLVLVRVCES
jgi:hypothetical protein